MSITWVIVKVNPMRMKANKKEGFMKALGSRRSLIESGSAGNYNKSPAFSHRFLSAKIN
jgi:hypothetical protein